MENIVITGAGGLIGGSVFHLLAGNPCFKVIPFYRSRMEGDSTLGSIADLTEEASYSALIEFHPNIIVHCAAVLPSASLDQPSAARVNRRMDDLMVGFCKANRVKLIYTSGTSVYGWGRKWKDENAPLNPRGAYIQDKAETEKRIQSQLDFYSILRISAPYGRKQKNKTVLKLFLEKAKANEAICYHGGGKREQDFTSAKDVAEAILKSAQDPEAVGIFNIASGSPISMVALAHLVKAIFPESKSRIRPSGLPDPQENYRARFDISKAGRVLDWAPKTPLEAGLRQWREEEEKSRV